jgi:hypothetical protein
MSTVVLPGYVGCGLGQNVHLVEKLRGQSMKSELSVWLLMGAVLGGTAIPLHGASSSYYTLRPDDAKAVYLTRNTFSPDSPTKR